MKRIFEVSGSTASILLDADECYWAIIESLPPYSDQETMRYAFEPWLPLQLEYVEASFVRVEPSGIVIACGVERDRIQLRLSEAKSGGSEIESIIPYALPRFVVEHFADADISESINALDFRCGAFESPRRRQSRRALIFFAAFIAVTLTGALSLGLVRDRSVAYRDAAAIRQDATDRILAALPSATGAAVSIDPRTRLAVELNRYRLTRDDSVSRHMAGDRAAVYLAILSSWPQNPPSSVDQLLIDQGSITIRGAVREPGDFEKLRQQVVGFDNEWVERTGSVVRGRVRGYEFTLVLERRALNTPASSERDRNVSEGRS